MSLDFGASPSLARDFCRRLPGSSRAIPLPTNFPTSTAAALCLRQLHPKITAFAGLRFNPQIASHSLDAGLHDRQPQAGAWIFVFSMKPLKGLENFGNMIGCNADSIVLHENLYGASTILDPNPDSRGHFPVSKFQRIANQVR